MINVRAKRTLVQIDEEILSLQNERAQVISKQNEEKAWPKTVTCYIHSNKENILYMAEELGLHDNGDCDSPFRKFRYVCYEIELTLVVHENGTAYVTHFEGKRLQNKWKAN